MRWNEPLREPARSLFVEKTSAAESAEDESGVYRLPAKPYTLSPVPCLSMKATQIEFRLRLLILLALYFIGFYAPWLRFGATAPATTAWLALSTTMARWQWLPLDQASLLVTSLAVLCAVVGAALRLWGTAYLGASVVHAGAMQAGKVMAAGPYRFVRNPLYLGSWILSLGIAILMPPSGALVFLVLEGLFYFRLILGEEAFLAVQQGETYLEYRRRVPRLVPSLGARIAAIGRASAMAHRPSPRSCSRYFMRFAWPRSHGNTIPVC